MTELIYPELSYKLNGIFFEVQNKLGHYSTEKQYADAIEELLKDYKLSYEREKGISIRFGEKEIKGNRVDFSIDNKILVDVKARSYIRKEDYLQMQRYLQSIKFKLGLIVNLKGKSVSIKRVVNPGFDSHD